MGDCAGSVGFRKDKKRQFALVKSGMAVLRYHHQAFPNTADADQSLSPASHCVFVGKGREVCIALQCKKIGFT